LDTSKKEEKAQMSIQATILISNDLRIQTNKHVKQFVENSSTSFTSLFLEGELVVVIKEVKEEKQTYEKIRMTAGAMLAS
jgi:leucyl aminopeptidase